MYPVIFIAVCAIVMTELYRKTAHPVLYALVNSAAGASLALMIRCFTECGTSIYSACLSSVLGVPGALLVFLANAAEGVIL